MFSENFREGNPDIHAFVINQTIKLLFAVVFK